MKLSGLLFAVAVTVLFTLPLAAQQESGRPEIDTSKINAALTSAGLGESEVQAVIAEVEKACAGGDVSVKQVRNLIKTMLKQKTQYAKRDQESQLKEDLETAIQAMKKAVEQGIDQKEARSMISLTAIKCIKSGKLGSELALQLENTVMTMAQTRIQTRNAAKEKEICAKEKAESAIKEKVGEGVAPQVEPGKEEPRKIRK